MIDLGTITQGERGTLTFTWQFPDYLTLPASISGATITAVMKNGNTGAVTAATGTITGTGATTATWAFSAEDSGTDGPFLVVFRAVVTGTATYTLPAQLVIEDNPAVDTIAAPPLVGIPADDAAWLAASEAGGALGDAAYEDVADLPFDAVGAAALRVAKAGDTMTGALVLSGAPTIDLHAATKKYVDDNAGGGADIGNWAVDGSDTFTLDKTATNPASIILDRVLPYSLGSSWRNNLQRSANTTLNDNVVGSWGWNIGNGGGNENASFPSTYLQLESHFELTAGVGWSEYHLNFFKAGSVSGTRPFQYNMRHTDGFVSAFYRSDSTLFQDNAGLVNYLTFTTPASGNGQLTATNLPFNITNTSTTAFIVAGASTLINADTTNSRVNIGGGAYAGTFNVLGSSNMFYNPTATSGVLFGLNATVTASHASASSGAVYATYIAATNGSAFNLAGLYGQSLTVRNDAAGTVATLTGMRLTVGTLTSCTATNVTGMYIEPYIPGTSSFWTGTEIASPQGAGTVFMYGHRIQNLGKSGMNTSYGIKIEDQSGSSTNYSLYTGTGYVRLGGIVNFAGTMGNSTKTVGTDAPADWVEILIGGVPYYLPAYVA